MATEYQYFGILGGNAPADRPTGVIRVSTTADGKQVVETFGRSLIWQPSSIFVRMARDEYKEIVEIDELVVERFIERVTKKVMAERDSSSS